MMPRHAGHHALETEWQQEAVGQMTVFAEIEAHAEAGGLHVPGGAVQNGCVKETVPGVQPHRDGVAGAVVGIIGVVEIGQQGRHAPVGGVGVGPGLPFEEERPGYGEVPARQGGRPGGGQADAEVRAGVGEAQRGRGSVEIAVAGRVPVIRMLGDHVMETVVSVAEIIV